MALGSPAARPAAEGSVAVSVLRAATGEELEIPILILILDPAGPLEHPCPKSSLEGTSGSSQGRAGSSHHPCQKSKPVLQGQLCLLLAFVALSWSQKVFPFLLFLKLFSFFCCFFVVVVVVF